MKNHSIRTIAAAILITSMLALFAMNSVAFSIPNSYSVSNTLYNDNPQAPVPLGSYYFYLARINTSTVECYAETTTPSYNATTTFKVWRGYTEPTDPADYCYIDIDSQHNGNDSNVYGNVTSIVTYNGDSSNLYHFYVNCKIKNSNNTYNGSVTYTGDIRKTSNTYIYFDI